MGKGLKQNTQCAVGETSPRLNTYKKTQGLAKWEDIQRDERNGLMDEAERKIRQIARYNEQNQILMQTMNSAGWSVMNVAINITDLQGKLFDLEEKLIAEGVNPLESPEWVKAREMLAKEVQFVHKHKIDATELQMKMKREKETMGDDNIFTIETE